MDKNGISILLNSAHRDIELVVESSKHNTDYHEVMILAGIAIDNLKRALEVLERLEK